jgi:hypothetical protein
MIDGLELPRAAGDSTVVGDIAPPQHVGGGRPSAGPGGGLYRALSPRLLDRYSFPPLG